MRVQVIRQMYPPEKGPTAGIPASGPAPVLLRVAELQKARPFCRLLCLLSCCELCHAARVTELGVCMH